MADPLRPIEPAHLETSEREAFQTEREKFRRDNLNRIRQQFQYHSVTYTARDGRQRVNQSLGLKVIPNANSHRGNRIPIAMDKIGMDFNQSGEAVFSFPTPSASDLRELDRDATHLAHGENIVHAAPMPAIPGPDIPDIHDDEVVLAAMEDFIDTKCGPGQLNPHLKKEA